MSLSILNRSLTFKGFGIQVTFLILEFGVVSESSKDDDRCTLCDYNNNDDNKDLTPVYKGYPSSTIRSMSCELKIVFFFSSDVHYYKNDDDVDTKIHNFI